jgi:hypothetical protein
MGIETRKEDALGYWLLQGKERQENHGSIISHKQREQHPNGLYETSDHATAKPESPGAVGQQ